MKQKTVLTTTLFLLSLTPISSTAGQPQTGLQSLEAGREVPQKMIEASRLAFNQFENELPAEVLSELRPELIHSSARGPEIVRFRRFVDGVEVYGQRALVLFGKDGKPLAARHNFAGTAPEPLAKGGDFRALKSGRYWLENEGRLVPVTSGYVKSRVPEREGMNVELRSWPEGKVLITGSTIDRISFDYRVFGGDDPFGHSQPHPSGVPDGFRPTLAVPQALLEIEELSARHDDPWLPADATETIGNNADSFFNSIREPDGSCDFDVSGFSGAWGTHLEPSEGDFRAQASGNNFNYLYDETISASDFFHSFSDCPFPNAADPQVNAKIVQAFYWANLLHDFFYDAGFDEVSGNAQEDNFGRGGIDGDRLIIHAGAPTTFISTPGDGESPVLVIGRNSRSASNRDSSLDFSVFAHEWGHYMVRRLVGGGSSFLSNTQGRALNEGWADFIGILVNVKVEDFSNGAPGATSSYAVGSYMNQDYMPFFSVTTSTGLSDSYFYGIRRWPYGPSNPFSFRHIEHGKPLPAGYDYFDWKSRSLYNSEIHTAGEVWAATLWDCAHSIFVSRTDIGFEANREHIAEYLVAGMKLTPVDPTFTEARDGLLLAMQALDKEDYALCRAAFVARGMGSGSLAPDRESEGLGNVVESFSDDDFAVSVVESSLKDDIRSFDNDGVLDQGETGTLTVTIRNTGFRNIRKLRLSPSRSANYRIRSKRTVRHLMPGDERVIKFKVRLTHDRDYDLTGFQLKWNARNRRDRGDGVLSINHRTQFDLRNWSGPDDAEFPETFSDWREEELMPTPHMDTIWGRLSVGGNTVYAAGDAYASYDQALESPPLLVSGVTDFHVTFDQAYQFQGGFDGTMVDKGIGSLEISIDDGGTWVELESFTGNSPGFPSLVTRDVNLGAAYALQTVRLRFRLLSQTATLYDGASNVAFPVEEAWYLDNIQFHGVLDEPLSRVIDEDGL